LARSRAKAGDLKRQILVAALERSDGDLSVEFTPEELLVSAWTRDPVPWGLRGFEKEHPDSDRIYKELDSRGKKSRGLVDVGLLEKVGPRLYRLTPKGLLEASELDVSDTGAREKASRTLETEVRRILEHPVFRAWLADQKSPERFRDAGSFWGVAPGTPSRVIRDRIRRVDTTLDAAIDLLDRLGVDEVGGDIHQRVLFDRTDIERCREFNSTLKDRFGQDLELLKVSQA
jgi:hypothetical protein